MPGFLATAGAANDHPDNRGLRVLYSRVPSMPGSSYELIDQSRYQRNATISSSGTPPTWEAAPGGQLGLKFDGTTQSGTAYNPSGAPGLTVAFWWKTTSSSGNYVAIGWFNLIWIGLSSGKLAFYPNSGGQAIEPTAIANDGKWHRCVATHLNGTSKVFVDGVERASAAGTLYTIAVISTMGVAQFGSSATFRFPGSLAGIRVHNVGFAADWAARDYLFSQTLTNDPRLAKFNSRSLLLPASTFTATVGLTVSAPAFAASASFAKPSYTASAALLAGHAALDATSKFTKPSYTASATFAAGSIAFAASATFTKPTYSAVASLAAAPAVLAASSTFTKPSFTAAASLTCGPAALGAVATFSKPVYSAAVSLNAAGATLGAAATFGEPTYAAVATLVVGPAALAASVDFDKPAYTASAALAAGPASLASIASFAKPVYSASVALAAPPAVLAAAVTTSNPSFTAAVALVSGGASLAASAIFSGLVRTAAVSLVAGPAELHSLVPLFVPDYVVSGTWSLAGNPVSVWSLPPVPRSTWTDRLPIQSGWFAPAAPVASAWYAWSNILRKWH